MAITLPIYCVYGVLIQDIYQFNSKKIIQGDYSKKEKKKKNQKVRMNE